MAPGASVRAPLSRTNLLFYFIEALEASGHVIAWLQISKYAWCLTNKSMSVNLPVKQA